MCFTQLFKVNRSNNYKERELHMNILVRYNAQAPSMNTIKISMY